MDCLTWKINQAEMCFCFKFYWSEKWREIKKKTSGVLKSASCATLRLPTVIRFRFQVSLVPSKLQMQWNIHIRNAIQTLRVIKSRVRAPDEEKKGVCENRKTALMKDKCTRAGSWVHAVRGSCDVWSGSCDECKGSEIWRGKERLFTIRDISTIYRQSLDIFHEIVNFYNIYNYNKGKPYKQTSTGGSSAAAFKFNFSPFYCIFLLVFGHSPLDPTVLRSVRVSVSVSTRKRLLDWEEFVTLWFIRVASEPRERRSRCFRRSRWQSSAAQTRLAWPPSVAFWPPDAACRPPSRRSSPSRRWILPLQSSLVCGLERTSSPPEDNHLTIKMWL